MDIINIINEELSRIISETSLNAIEFNEFFHLIKDSDELPYIATEYGYKIGSDDIDGIIRSDDFHKWLRNEFNLAIDRLRKVIQNGKINIWRTMTVNNKWLDELQNSNTHLGIYWSWDEYAVDTYWDEVDGNEIIMESNVNENHVNWVDTVLTNIQFGTEKEIRLFRNTPLKLFKLYVNNSDILDSPKYHQIKDKVFYA